MMIPFYFLVLLQSQSRVNIWTEMIFSSLWLIYSFEKRGYSKSPTSSDSHICFNANKILHSVFWLEWEAGALLAQGFYGDPLLDQCGSRILGEFLGGSYRAGVHVIHHSPVCGPCGPLLHVQPDCSVFPTRIQAGTPGIIQDIIGLSSLLLWKRPGIPAN